MYYFYTKSLAYLYKNDIYCTLNDIGLSMSAAINIFLKTVARERRIPFELTADPFYSRENMILLEKRVADVKSGKSTLKEHELLEVNQ